MRFSTRRDFQDATEVFGVGGRGNNKGCGESYCYQRRYGGIHCRPTFGVAVAYLV